MAARLKGNTAKMCEQTVCLQGLVHKQFKYMKNFNAPALSLQPILSSSHVEQTLHDRVPDVHTLFREIRSGIMMATSDLPRTCAIVFPPAVAPGSSSWVIS